MSSTLVEVVISLTRTGPVDGGGGEMITRVWVDQSFVVRGLTCHVTSVVRIYLTDWLLLLLMTSGDQSMEVDSRHMISEPRVISVPPTTGYPQLKVWVEIITTTTHAETRRASTLPTTHLTSRTLCLLGTPGMIQVFKGE